MYVYETHWIIRTIRIRTDVVVFLCHRVNGSEPSSIGRHVTGAVVIPIDSMGTIEFLAVVPESLDCIPCALTKQSAEGIVVVYLLCRARRTHYHTVVAQMVFEVVVVIGRCAAEGDIAPVNQDLFQYVVLVYHIPAIVRRDGCR